MMQNAELSVLKERLAYVPENGVLTWAISRRGTAKAGTIAGTVDTHGYRQIKINGRLVLAHRIVWAMHHGTWPTGQIDHINGDRLDNRIDNLREVDQRGNSSNSPKHRAGKLVGCYFQKQIKKWVAQYRENGRTYHLGCFSSEHEAHSAYLEHIALK